jgi:metal-responsive CopG/Arc/MetJ family transcriptional regulator
VRKKAVGRPALGQNKRVRVNVRVKQRLLDKLELLAEQNEMKRGELAADLLERAIKRATLDKSLR